jgi:CheY-like chemotaxis protein/anti-sigma regulatory factor (Ser/Thr protein kinase)
LQDRTRQLRALACELTLAEERERQRIAGLIHDHLQQMLVAALLNLGMLRQKLADIPVAEDFGQIEAILRDAVETTRSLTAELSPTVLHQCGLAAALKWLGSWCQQKYGLVVDVDVDEELNPGQEASISLYHCVREMLFNTVKHSGVERASVQMSRPEFGSVLIEVQDGGHGFDLDEVRAREGQEGGFGLFNVRERVELLGGRLEVESSPGNGCRFTIWIPELSDADDFQGASSKMTSTAVEHGLPLPPLSTLLEAGKSIRLMIADDHPVVREGLARLLQSTEGFEVVAQASDGSEAVRLARECQPDFVIMDLNMPHLDGFQATAAIIREVPKTRVLGLSTHADAEQRAAMIRAGAVDLFHKNISSAKLIAALRGGLQQD